MTKKIISYIVVFLFALGLHAQDKENTLSYEEFISNVINHHPLAKSANLRERVAKAKLLNAKGSFDPVLTSSVDQKDFQGKEYYSIFENKITIPTPIGVNVVGGFSNNNGKFLNPENKTTYRGLWNAGVEVDLLQGFLVNQRRTDLKAAKVYQKIAKNQQMQLLNELVYKASKAYADWQQYTLTYEFLQNNIKLSYLYLHNTKRSLESGEKTSIDTLEARVYLQNNLINLEKYKQLLLEKKLKVENHMWYKNQPILLKETIRPERSAIPQNELMEYKDDLEKLPIIAEKVAKKEQLEIKQRLNKEKLKPKLKVKYNPLFETTKESLRPAFNADDYKWGAKLSFPILFRQGIGKVREGKYKINDVEYDIAYKKTEVKNKLVANQQNQEALIKQIFFLEKNVDGYARLLKAEEQRFEFGESSLFLINKRQEKLIESELKLLSSQNKLITNYLDYLLLTNKIIPKE